MCTVALCAVALGFAKRGNDVGVADAVPAVHRQPAEAHLSVGGARVNFSTRGRAFLQGWDGRGKKE